MMKRKSFSSLGELYQYDVYVNIYYTIINVYRT